VRALEDSFERGREEPEVFLLRRRGILPMAIADTLGCPDYIVRRILRDWIDGGELEQLPRWYAKGSKGWARLVRSAQPAAAPASSREHTHERLLQVRQHRRVGSVRQQRRLPRSKDVSMPRLYRCGSQASARPGFR
jgi:hypothetical protein